MTNEDVIERFRKSYQAYHRISTGRALEQRRVLADFSSVLGGRLLTEATTEDFQGYLATLIERGLHVNTVRKKANMIRPFIGWAYAMELIDADRYLRLKAVKNPRGSSPRGLPRPYKRAELDRFFSELESALPLLPERGPGSQLLQRWIVGKSKFPRVRGHAMRLQVEAIVALALHCGLRRYEIFQLTPDELHYDNEYIVVRGKRSSSVEKVREVPFTEPAREAVRRWLDFRLLMRPEEKDATWLSTYYQWWNRPMSFDRFGELLAKEISPGWELHRFRHTFATERLRAGTPLEIVSTIMGHANLEETRGYAEIVKQDTAKALAKTEPEFVDRVANRAA